MLNAVTLPTPEEWLKNFNAKIADVKAKTEQFQEDLERSGATETSPDGSVSVTVAPNGSLQNLRIDESAWRGNGAELAQKIMGLARKAQRQAAMNVAEAFAPLGGPDHEALHMLTGFIPEEEEDEEPEGPSYSFAEERTPGQGPTAAASPPPPRPQPPAEPRRRPRRDDEEDFGEDNIFGR